MFKSFIYVDQDDHVYSWICKWKCIWIKWFFLSYWDWFKAYNTLSFKIVLNLKWVTPSCTYFNSFLYTENILQPIIFCNIIFRNLAFFALDFSFRRKISLCNCFYRVCFYFLYLQCRMLTLHSLFLSLMHRI